MKKLIFVPLLAILMFGCKNVDVGLGVGVYHHVGPHRHGASYTHWVGPERKDEFRYEWEFQLGHHGHHHPQHNHGAPAAKPVENKPDTDTKKKKRHHHYKRWWHWKKKKHHHRKP